MSEDTASSYAPRSPDLSSLFPAAGPPQHQHQHQPPPQPPPLSLHNINNYAPPSSALRHPPSQQYQPPPPYGSTNYQNTQQPHHIPTSSPYGPLQTGQAEYPSEYPRHAHADASPVPANHRTYQPPNPHHQPPQSSHHRQPSYPPTAYGQPYAYPGAEGYQPPIGAPGNFYAPPDLPAQAPNTRLQPGSEMPTRRAAAAAAAAAVAAANAGQTSEEEHAPTLSPEPAPPKAVTIEPSPVRTKFPTARIKRIMQADEEVGKVAQQTPIAVGKALEMFMTQLVTKSAEVAKEKGSKRVTAQMLKTVVEADDQWDFLREIVGKVEPEREGSRSKTKAETESEEEESFEPKKKGRGGRKRSKAD